MTDDKIIKALECMLGGQMDCKGCAFETQRGIES